MALPMNARGHVRFEARGQAESVDRRFAGVTTSRAVAMKGRRVATVRHWRRARALVT